MRACAIRTARTQASELGSVDQVVVLRANPDLHVRLIHGDSDEVIPSKNSAGLSAAPKDAGYDVELIIVDNGHSELPDTSVPTIMDVAR